MHVVVFLYRISVENVLNHCYFWSKERQLEFLEAASDILEFMPSTKDHMIEHDAADVIGANWMDRIDAKGFIGINCMYNTSLYIRYSRRL